MADYPDSVMIALLPTTIDWCKIALPHLTLVYAGLIEDLKPSAHNALAKEGLALAMTCSPLTLGVEGADVFGDDEEGKVDVIRLSPSPQLLAMRSVVEDWNASKHPFNPHVTVGPEGSISPDLPSELTFDRLLVAWGNTHLIYKLA